MKVVADDVVVVEPVKPPMTCWKNSAKPIVPSIPFVKIAFIEICILFTHSVTDKFSQVRYLRPYVEHILLLTRKAISIVFLENHCFVFGMWQQ